MQITEENVVEAIQKCNENAIRFIIDHYGGLLSARNSFKQWLAAIAKYKAIDYQRKRLAEKGRLTVLDSMEPSTRQGIQSPQEQELAELLAPLTPMEREIFHKYYVEGTPSHEIAEHFKAKPSWVHNKLSRGRKKIRDFFIQHSPSLRR